MVVPLLRPAADFTRSRYGLILFGATKLVVNLKKRLAVYGNAVIKLLLYTKSNLCGPLPEFFGGVGYETALTKEPTLWYVPCGTLALVDVPDFDGAPDCVSSLDKGGYH